jgi:type II secretory pathway pseudopilin PulG
MNSAERQNGFVLLAVIVLMALMGVGLAVWTVQSRDLSIHTKMQTAQAQLDNAVASAAQWANANHTTLKKTAKGQSIHLDLAGLQIPGLECQCRVIDRNSRQIKIEITAVGSARPRPVKTIRLTL